MIWNEKWKMVRKYNKKTLNVCKHCEKLTKNKSFCNNKCRGEWQRYDIDFAKNVSAKFSDNYTTWNKGIT